ncbi:LysE family translocator [Comamonas sp. Y33R10-2]|uniref:LysE family translocator n=1 Tax=Comamonas sp. Y33R10-2 TaxID=2853257 RepID=UPI001C5CB3C2|nr:LysE family translocator [Comamonas sp. Y33R10-2]QXZ09942.1 LysE family translocator [Comamonas sp. Y33R10-2]
MPTWDVLIAFFGVSVLLGLSPGPDNLFVLVQSAQRGWRVGLCVVLGLCLGVVGHTAAVALGLAAIVAASPMLFTALKVCGAAYLLYMAWGAWRAPVEVSETAQAHAQRDVLTLRSAMGWVGRGVVMNLTNPKVLIFFLAFLPQFADPARGSVPVQIMVLGCVFMISASLVFGSIACFSGLFGQLLQRSARAQRWLNRIAATVFGALALRLVMVQR